MSNSKDVFTVLEECRAAQKAAEQTEKYQERKKTQDAIEKIVDYVISSEHCFVVEEIANYETFYDWADFVLERTVYGAAMKLNFSYLSDSEMIRDLREIWDTHA